MATPCACTSGQPYAQCCGRFHKGADPESPDQLVRARYAAFALGEVEFLWRTLHSSHPDRAHGRDRALAAFRAASSQFRYMGLNVLDVRPDGRDRARVLYYARIFRKGSNVSFVELAEFEREGGAWSYLAGKTMDASTRDPSEVTLKALAALYDDKTPA